MPSLKQIIEDTDTRAGRIFDLTIQALIVLSLLAFSIETLPDLDVTFKYWLGIWEASIVLIFTAEYIARVAVSSKRLSYIFSFYGLIDLAAILPFYLFPGFSTQWLRALRLVRLFRALKLARYSTAIDRLIRALRWAREELVVVLCMALLMLYLAAVGIYYFEHTAQPEQFKSVFHSLWWALATLTTVGYGDVYPVTLGGKVFTGLILLIGLGVVAMPASIIAAALTEVTKKPADSETSSGSKE